jgi:hypothetical protein
MSDLNPRWGVRQTAVSTARAAEEGRERYAGRVQAAARAANWPEDDGRAGRASDRRRGPKGL